MVSSKRICVLFKNNLNWTMITTYNAHKYLYQWLCILRLKNIYFITYIKTNYLCRLSKNTFRTRQNGYLTNFEDPTCCGMKGLFFLQHQKESLKMSRHHFPHSDTTKKCFCGYNLCNAHRIVCLYLKCMVVPRVFKCNIIV